MNPKNLLANLLIALVLTVSAFAAESVGLMWDANIEPTLAGYNLFYVGPDGVIVRQPVGNLTTAYTPILPTGSFTFWVTAYDIYGTESERSETVTYSVKLSPPKNFKHVIISAAPQAGGPWTPISSVVVLTGAEKGFFQAQILEADEPK